MFTFLHQLTYQYYPRAVHAAVLMGNRVDLFHLKVIMVNRKGRNRWREWKNKKEGGADVFLFLYWKCYR